MRGLKSGFHEEYIRQAKSHPIRDAWIEIFRSTVKVGDYSRIPYGMRGLKYGLLHVRRGPAGRIPYGMRGLK